MITSKLLAAVAARELIARREPAAWALADAFAEREVDRLLDEATAPIIATRPRVQSTGSLWAWWGELRQGVGGQHIDRPSTWRCDALMRAAALEAEAKDWDRLQIHSTADRLRMRAAEILAEAAKHAPGAAA